MANAAVITSQRGKTWIDPYHPLVRGVFGFAGHQSARAALTATAETAEQAQLMTAALGDCRILPANEAYWRGQPVAVLRSFLKDAQPLAALKGLQTNGKAPGGDPTKTTLSAEELAVCKSTGVSPEAFTAAKTAAKGV